jgi:hypothetical protein
MTKGAKIAVAAGLLGLVALTISKRIEPKPERDPARARAEQAEDEARLKALAMYVALRIDIPFTKGGQLDVYRIVMDAEKDERAIVDLCYSARARNGPNIEEIQRGDYKRFPYARINWKFTLRDGNSTAVLWDGSPQSSGQRLVALDDGTCQTIHEPEFAAFLAAHEK